MSRSQFLALLGFAFVAAWIGFNFGYALLCLLGAALFYAGGAVIGGEVDLGDLQARLQNGGQGATPPPTQRAARPRVR